MSAPIAARFRGPAARDDRDPRQAAPAAERALSVTERALRQPDGSVLAWNGYAFADMSRLADGPAPDPAREAVEAQYAFIDRALDGLDGDPPADICATLTLGPRRAALARYVAWCRKLAGELEELLAKRTELEAIVAAPGETERAVAGAVRRAVDTLLGRTKDAVDAGDRKALDERFAEQKHLAEAAAAALVELAEPLKIAQMRLDRLNERQAEFLKPALVELADGFGKLYLAKIAEVRDISRIMFGLAHEAADYGSGVERPVDIIRFPNCGVASAMPEQLTIPVDGDVELWRGAAERLLADPFCARGKLLTRR